MTDVVRREDELVAERHVASSRWDWFVDPDKWEKLLSLVGLEAKGLMSQQYTVNFLREGGMGA